MKCVAYRIALLALLVLVGCGDGRDPKKSYLQGTVTLDGQPLADARVHLSPMDGPAGNVVAEAATDEQGHYRIDNIRARRYKVLVRKYPPNPPGQPDPPLPPGGRPSLLPKLYDSHLTTPFEIHLEAGEQTHDYALNSAAPKK